MWSVETDALNELDCVYTRLASLYIGYYYGEHTKCGHVPENELFVCIGDGRQYGNDVDTVHDVYLVQSCLLS